jgi:hypothetical protein
MPALSVQKTLAYKDVDVLLACDARQRSFVGIGCGENADGEYVFIEIDRVTGLELERGTVDLYTVMTERCAGMVFHSTLAATMAT